VLVVDCNKSCARTPFQFNMLAYITTGVCFKMLRGHSMVFQFFLSRYLTDFDKKNTVCCKSWLHNTVKFSNFLDQWLSVNCRSKFPVFCGIVVRNFH
jgi:hypothetical protein